MLAASLLVKKRQGHHLSDDEIRFLVDGFCSGEVTDYQMSALAMAICLRGMDQRETATLTRAMLESGRTLPRDGQSTRPRVDKHSTGGLGDKVSLVMAPLLAVCGVDVPMISGRGLGLSGGTLDKLESIPGFRTQYGIDESAELLREVGTFIIGATDAIAPADRRLYALRDVTGTVESIPLITASILSKKLAANLDALMMDVKVGSGAFMKTPDQATALAETIVRVGSQAGLPTGAVVSDMDQPLGAAIGNAIEVNEAIDVLRGGGPAEVLELTIELAARLLLAVKVCETMDEATGRLRRAVDRGDAMERFEKLVHAQGGQLRYPLPLAERTEIVADRSGFVAACDCVAIGEAIVEMGGGRRRAADRIDPAVGVLMHVRHGDRVEAGMPLMSVHVSRSAVNDYLPALQRAIEIGDQPVASRPLIVQRW